MSENLSSARQGQSVFTPSSSSTTTAQGSGSQANQNILTGTDALSQLYADVQIEAENSAAEYARQLQAIEDMMQDQPETVRLVPLVRAPTSVEENDKCENVLFIAGFPISYTTLQIINEVMLLASAHDSEVDVSLLRKDDLPEQRYVYITFPDVAQAISAFEDMQEKTLGLGEERKLIFVDFAFKDVAINFVRFAAFKEWQWQWFFVDDDDDDSMT